MLARNGYLYTSIPADVAIRGGRSTDATCLTNEHWHWINEVVRTYEAMGSLSPRPRYATFDAPAAKNAVAAMAPSRSVLDGWVARADAVRTAPEVDIEAFLDEEVTWASSYGTEPSDAATCPHLSEAAITPRLHLGSRGPFPHPDGMSAPRSVLEEWCSMKQDRLVYCVRQAYRPSRHSVSVFNGSGGVMGGFGGFFHVRNAGWQCNGTASSHPEGSAALKLAPFWHNPSQPELRRASTYFREVTDAASLVFSYEQDIGYGFPAVAWPHASGTQVGAYVVYGAMAAAVWKGRERGDYVPDAKRSWAFAFRGIDHGSVSANEGVDYGLLRGATVRSRIETVFAGWPGQVATAPIVGDADGYDVVGHQTYAWPEAVVAIARAPARDVGE